jgi:competence protein ComEC
MSCVLRVQGVRQGQGPGPGQRNSVLLTGDIEAAQEADLVQRLGPALRSDILLVPHHGSRTSSTAAFIDAVSPHTAVVQAAYRSRYGHPAPAVLARYQTRGIAVVRSDFCGGFIWSTAQGGTCTRTQRARYWHHAGQIDAAR